MKNVTRVLMNYKRFSNNNISIFAGTLVTNGKDKEFDPYRTALDTLGVNSENYYTKLQLAKNRGRVEVDNKNIALAALLGSIDVYAYLINSAAVIDPSIIDRSGFTPTATNTNVRPNPNFTLSAPFGLSFDYGKKTGEIMLYFDVADPDKVLTNGVEWVLEEDIDGVWNKGGFINGKKGLVSGLPVHKYLLIKVYSIGTVSNQTSDFSTNLRIYLP